MPTLLQINITANWGSTGKIAESIGLAVMKRGWGSYIAYGRIANPSKSNLIQVGGKLNTYIHFAFNRLFDMEGRSSEYATKKLVKRIEKIKPDVVQLHNIHDHFLNYQILFEYLNQTDIKVVWTFHDCWAFTGHCFHFVTENCERWKTNCYDCPLVHEYPNTLMDRSMKNYELKMQLFGGCKNLTIVPCSDWMGDFVKQSFLADKKIHVIKNGVDLNVFKPSTPKLSLSDGKFRILAVSNVWNKEKGYYDIFKLRESLSDDYIITIVGLSAEQVKELPSGIVGIQRTQNVQELVELYSSSDVLINPTYADTFPTVNLEALACGLPVITYKTGGSPEAIRDGHACIVSKDGIERYSTGIVINQGDVTNLSNAIMWMKGDPLSWEDCRRRAELYFDKNKCFEKYINLYEEILNKSNGK